MSATGREILIVEDDAAIGTGLALNLRIEGYDATLVHDGEAALVAIAESPPDLIVLDISLPKKNGLQVLAELREQGTLTPVIVLSARQEEFDKVAALRLGADDYVTKPFALAELLARIYAVLRRVGVSTQTPPTALPAAVLAAPPPLGFEDVVVDLETRTVTRTGQLVELTKLEFNLLAYFLQHRGQVLSRDHLLRHVWGVDVGTPRTVDNFVAQLRAKLETNPDEPRHLVTVRGSGYRFDP